MKRFRYAVYFLLTIVILANIALSTKTIFRTHFSPTDPGVSEPGAFTDLFPRWHGSREMILHCKNPYSEEKVLENQRAFYGAFSPDDGVLREPIGFAYPATIAIPLFPFLFMPYQWALALVGLLSIGILTWGFIRWSEWCAPDIGREWQLLLVSAAIGLHPSISVILLRQPTIFAFLGLTAMLGCLKREKYIGAGLWLALACVKPQVAFFVALGMHIFAIFDWKRLRIFLFSFWIANIIAVGLCCIFLPDWPLKWLESIVRYNSEAFGAVSTVDFWVRIRPLAWSIKAAVVLMTLMLWKRQTGSDKKYFAKLFSVSIAAALLVFPAGHIYNHIFIYPLWFLISNEVLSPKRHLRSAGWTFSISAFLLWIWATLPLVLKNAPPLVNLLGLPGEMFTSINLWAWPWNLSFLIPPLLFFAAFLTVDSKHRKGV